MNAAPPPPPATSRREAQRLARRQSILAVAADSFFQNGYAGTTMSDIAATLGGSKGTLWSYFPSKEELFAAVLIDATTAYRAELSRILNPLDDIATSLRHFCVSMLNKVTSPTAVALHRLVVAEGTRFPEIATIFFEHAPRSTRRLLADYLRAAMAKGQLRDADPDRAAHALMTLNLSGCHQQIVWGLIDGVTDEMIEHDAAFALDLFLRAYAPPTATGRPGSAIHSLHEPG